LKENPILISLNDDIYQVPSIENVLLVMLENCSIILPESSNSANFLRIDANKAYIIFNQSLETPKVLIKPNKKVHIIDKKNLFHIKPQLTEDLIPHTYLEIFGNELDLNFFINEIWDPLGKVTNLGVFVRSPKSDNNVAQIRRAEWNKKFKSTILYKPSLTLEINNGNINTNLVMYC
jgi:hypothetical protein